MTCCKRTALLLLSLSACAVEGRDLEDEIDATGSAIEPSNPVLPIENGTTVRGAGLNQEWEGIVMTRNGGRGYCSASFISDQHLVSAAHCYARDGVQAVSLRAPTLSGAAWQVFEAAVVKRASTNNSVDIAIVDLGSPQAWATPARRFLLNASAPSAAELHVYGYGANNETGAGVGTLRAAPERAIISVSDNGRGYLSGTTRDSRFCKGDSGGPALKEGSAAVLWGINQSFVPTAARRAADRQPVCADVGSLMRFTSISANLAFIERTLGKSCKRVQVDGQQAAQCW